jgi:hypothetical protein
MKRNLKALGLALVAVFAMSAIAAAAAQAEEIADFSAASYPTTIDAVSEGAQVFKVPGLPNLTCTSLGKSHAILEKESGELTATDITFENCHVVSLGITFPVTVDSNKCHFTFTADTYTPAATEGHGQADGDVHIKECENGSITITVFKAGSTEHLPGDLRCTIHVPNQTPGAKTNVTYKNETTEGVMAVTVEAHLTEVKTEVTESTLCGSTRTVNSTYEGSFWAKATASDGKTYIDTTVTGTKP